MTSAIPLQLQSLEHLPSGYTVYATLFMSVFNSYFLQAQLMGRNPEFEYVFLDASTAISRLHVLAAVYKAILLHASGNLKTPNVHSEVVLSMSASNNIAEAYRKFGIRSSTKDVIVIKIAVPTTPGSSPQQTLEDIWSHISTHVEGSPFPFTDKTIAYCKTSWSTIHKMYKITGSAFSRLESLNGEANIKETEMLALGSMALRGL